MPLTFTSLCKAEPRRPHCAWTDHWSCTFSNCKWYTLSEPPCRKYSSAFSVCMVRSFVFGVLPVAQRHLAAQQANALHGGGKRLAVRAVKAVGCAFIGAKRRALTEEAGG